MRRQPGRRRRYFHGMELIRWRCYDGAVVLLWWINLDSP